MKRTKTLLAALAIAGAATSLVPATPAIAAQRDINLLKSYIGDWAGRGKLTQSGKTESMYCELAVTNAAPAKVNLNGGCGGSFGKLVLRGTLGYISAKNRYEAVVTSNTKYSGRAIGRRSGNSIRFNLQDPNASDGDDYRISVGMGLTGGGITVTFRAIDSKGRTAINAVVPMKK